MTSGINRILETESPAAGVENTYPFIHYPLVLVVNSLHFVQKLFYHESTKGRKHERKEKFRAFKISCFRD